MAALHSALQALAPLNFSDVPTAPDELDTYISDIFAQTELLIESVPIPAPDESHARSRAATTSSMASTSSEMSVSSARSLPPAPDHAALQKEWGKPFKISPKENPLSIPVYKLGGKDGRGAWFARRSVHEGLGFARFKRSLEREFPETLKVQGAPGEGNIRGIGGERMVEDITVEGKGRVQVYYLSAQFPGPTTPRDFVTLLVTSSRALKGSHSSEIPELAPRHYMIISKPCHHPECPPKDGMVRGQYESVEFIREIPRQPVSTKTSSIDLAKARHDRDGRHSPNLEHEAVLRRAKMQGGLSPFHHDSRSSEDISRHGQDRNPSQNATDAHASPTGRKRSATVGQPQGHGEDATHGQRSSFDDYDPETNPVEWIMITRSDPGGGIPRFMVERGTPSSIVADAYKFLDWATQQEVPEDESQGGTRMPPPRRRESYESWQANGHLAGLNAPEAIEEEASTEPATSGTQKSEVDNTEAPGGVLANVTDMLSSTISTYAPQSVLDRLHGVSSQSATEPFPSIAASSTDDDGDDATSTITSNSFASADSHFEDDDVNGRPSRSSSLASPGKDKQEDKPLNHHEKELAKLAQRRQTLQKKLEATREKLVKDNENQTAKEQEAIRKAEEKHEREMRKHEEKYQKDIAKLEAKKAKEAQKLEEKKRRAADKDEKTRLTRERDEAREELAMLKQEQEIWQKQVGDLQRENTRLIARIGKLESMDGSAIKALIDEEKGITSRQRGVSLDGLSQIGASRSRSSSVRKSAASPLPMSDDSKSSKS